MCVITILSVRGWSKVFQTFGRKSQGDDMAVPGMSATLLPLILLIRCQCGYDVTIDMPAK